MLLKSTVITLAIAFMSVPTASLPLDRDLTAQSDTCSYACYELYKPVCGQSKTGAYRSFSNECFLNQYNICHPQATYQLVKQGSCEE
ncbi:hypothetical protein BG006_000764 [Podila minutissima]|uniref:Kazal-like domain-containing protein n=1 Tax=Podila minutissima TaxID=64525 RepID=A0A9P5VHL8_9FUNG|nr:hypothetical protein BG006_000764 [Podila minutissima]